MPSTRQTADLFSVSTDAVAPVTNDAAKSSVKPAHSSEARQARLQVTPALFTNHAGGKRVTQFWLAIHLPQWSLNAFHMQAIRPAPIVIVAAAGSQQQVHACNAVAESLGIEPGMSLKAAYALSNELQTLSRDPEREQFELERLAEWAGRFTPRVSVEPPDGLLLEVKGSLRLFGGAHALCKRVFTELQAKNIHAQLSMAPTAAAALCFARHPHAELYIARNFEALRMRLVSLPIAHLRWPAPVQQLLHAMGVHTVGECQRLPRDGLARRIGTSLLNELDQLAGRVSQVRRHFVPRERFVAHYDFEMELAEVERLEHGLQPMLEQLEQFLRVRQAAIQALKVKLYSHARIQSGAMPPMVVRFVAPVWKQSQMWAVLKERLSRISLSAPVLSLELLSSALMPLHAGVQNNDLFTRSTERDSERGLRLIERLRARLGERAVYGLSLSADHRPELAWKKNSASIFSGDKKTPAAPQSPRPLWLLDEPQLLRVAEARPYYHGRVQFEEGPERIESGWWDGRDVTRDYYIARATNGQRLWVYRDRQAPHAWFLHGIFS